MQPRFKPILESHRGHIEVISQAFQAEIPSLFHVATLRGIQENLKSELAIDFQDMGAGSSPLVPTSSYNQRGIVDSLHLVFAPFSL